MRTPILPAFERNGEWFFFLGDPSDLGWLYGPFSTEAVATERQAAVLAYTEYAPGCHCEPRHS